MQGRRRARALSSVRLHLVSETSGSQDNQIEAYCLSDAGLAAIGDGFSKIEKLSLIWCSNATSAGLKSMAEKCKFLKSLDLQVNLLFYYCPIVLVIIKYGQFCPGRLHV